VGCVRRSALSASHARALKTVLLITAVFMGAEVVGGIVANSLALLADAGHMLTDVAAIGLSLFAAHIARRPATQEKTYGYLRLEILAALINGTALFVMAGAIVWEAVRRMGQPPEVQPGIMFGVAAAGLVANLVAMRLLHEGHSHSLNVRGAYLHVISDLLGSIGAILGGVIIFVTGWNVVDAVISVVIALLILVSAWRLVRESVDVVLEGTPAHIALSDVQAQLAGIPGVHDVHDLHVWTVTSGVVAMSGHVVVRDPARHQGILETAHSRLVALGIQHVTMQIEQEHTCEEPRTV
jgi:cobalt-zinc-cadmium efflux system protein